MKQPHITEKPELTVAGRRRAFIHGLSADANNHTVIGPLWCQFLEEAESVPHRVGAAMYGVITSEPEEERHHPDALQYLAGVAVDAVEALPTGLMAQTIPAATFAVFTHVGPIANIEQMLREAYRVWLPESEYEHFGIADVEVYDHRFHGDSEDSEMEYWISVRRRTNG